MKRRSETGSLDVHTGISTRTHGAIKFNYAMQQKWNPVKSRPEDSGTKKGADLGLTNYSVPREVLVVVT